MKVFPVLATAFMALSCCETAFVASPEDNIYEIVEQAVLHSRENPGCRTAVLLSDGTYLLDSPLRLDSVSGPFRIAAVRGAHPVLAGDREIVSWQASEAVSGALEADIPDGFDLGNAVGDSGRVDFYAGGLRQQLARWPDADGFTHAGRCLDPDMSPSAIVKDMMSHDNGVMEYTDSRIARWADEKDPMLLGYWCWDWYESFKKLADVDTVARCFTVEPLTDLYGYRDNCRFFGFNLLCELDSGGEYYIDRAERRIYWMAPDGFLQAPADTRLSVLSDAMISVTGCRGVRIQGLGMRGGRGSAVDFDSCSDCLLKDCSISCFGEDAVLVCGGTGNAVVRCGMKQLGKMGVNASGGDRRTLEGADFSVRGCTVRDFALYKHTYCPAVQFMGVGARICGCEFCNSTSSAIILGGNDIVVERNLFHDLVRESDDQGAIESYGNYSYRRMTVRFNRFRDINGGTERGSAAVRFDDFISGNEVYGNVFDRCGSLRFGAVQIHGGRDNRVHHNLFRDCNHSLSCSPWTWNEYQRRLERLGPRWQDVDLAGGVYASRYPELLEPTDSLNNNRNYFYRNISLRTDPVIKNGSCIIGVPSVRPRCRKK